MVEKCWPFPEGIFWLVGWMRQGPRAPTAQIAVVFDIADDSGPCKG